MKDIMLFSMKSFSLINALLPKNKNIILFFGNNADFNDNNKALLSQLQYLGIDKTHKIFVSIPDYKTNRLPSNHVRYISPLLAPFIFIFAKYCFYDGGTLKIRPSRTQQVISLWHGIPLKKIGLLANEQNSKHDRYNDFTKILVPHASLIKIYTLSFGCTEQQILISNAPKNDHLFINNDAAWSLTNTNKHDFSKTLLWMPTFRKSLNGRYQDGHNDENELDLPIVHNMNDLIALNNDLIKLNILLVIKLHPYSTLNSTIRLPILSHLKLIKNSDLNNNGIINYQFVNHFDGLLTDYSSIYFDYLLLNRPIAFTIDDITAYSNTRGFNFKEPIKLMPGDHIQNTEQLVVFLEKFVNNIDPYKSQREQLRAQLHAQTDGKATDTLIKYLGLN